MRFELLVSCGESDVAEVSRLQELAEVHVQVALWDHRVVVNRASQSQGIGDHAHLEPKVLMNDIS